MSGSSSSAASASTIRPDGRPVVEREAVGPQVDDEAADADRPADERGEVARGRRPVGAGRPGVAPECRAAPPADARRAGRAVGAAGSRGYRPCRPPGLGRRRATRGSDREPLVGRGRVGRRTIPVTVAMRPSTSAVDWRSRRPAGRPRPTSLGTDHDLGPPAVAELVDVVDPAADP